MRHHPSYLLGVALLFMGAIFLLNPQPTQANPDLLGSRLLTESPSKRGRMARGGQLYDNWAVTLGKSLPSKEHPAYPKLGQKTGGETWRCSTCHGWDYRGAEGINKKGAADYTGIIGLEQMRGVAQKKIIQIIRNPIHQFSQATLPDDAVADLALFVSEGQMDMSALSEPNTQKAQGESQGGALFFHTICVRCHGVDGRHINLSQEKDNPLFLGAIAKRNPWKSMHKIRNGQPGTIMISFITLLNEADQMNILSYVQTLPEK
ncbi:MAG: hypothetical protein HQL72_03000 [Magnetococcales bacterium]|nr:hypothetical protein [Magnetococcales bacterium]